MKDIFVCLGLKVFDFDDLYIFIANHLCNCIQKQQLRIINFQDYKH